MKLSKSFKLAWNILVHSKLRSWLTIIGIVIGVAAIVAIVSIGEGAKASVNDRLGGLGADIITVSPGGGRASSGFRMDGPGAGSSTTTTTKENKNLTNKDVQVIKNIEGVLYVQGVVSGRSSLTYLAETGSVTVQGVDPSVWKDMTTVTLDSGRMLNSGDTNVVVLGNRVATKMFKQALPLNMNIVIGGKTFKIVGILSASSGGEDNQVFMSDTDAREVLEKGTGLNFDSITIKAKSADDVDYVVNTTDSRLQLSRHVSGKKKDFSITSAKAIQANIQSITQTFTIFLGAIAAVSLVVGAVGVANTMFTSVLEKTREIGVMKAIGAKNFDIMIIFLINSGLVGLVGGIIGVLIGSGVSAVLPNLMQIRLGATGNLRTLIPMSLIIEAILISLLIGMIAGVIPAYRASKLKPVEALRYE